MKIAVIGGGISGMAAARLLADRHEVVLYEAAGYVGGHTNTVEVENGEGPVGVDTGFMVFNDWTYPNFVKLLKRLDVPSQPTCMSFSVRCDRSGLEYNGTSVNTLFAQRRNLLRPSFLRMVRDILRFNREAPSRLDCDGGDSVGGFLAERGYSRFFVEHYLVPMSAAIWSSPPKRILEFPLRFFLRFLDNHGMLSVNDRPVWRVVRGGSKRYVDRLVAPIRRSIRLKSPVQRVRRFPDRVEVRTRRAGWESFDQVVMAAHSDQALAALEDPTPSEREILGAIKYQPNDTVLHTDARLLPRSRRARASWNARLGDDDGTVAVTYHSNRLQSLACRSQYCVSLNQTHDVDPSRILWRTNYQHPLYSLESQAAQRRHGEISGRNRTHYCGAYWGYGFHEDGLNSALRVCRQFGVEW